MSTHSTIAVQHQDGTISQIYCHWDGYISHNGALLVEYYDSLELAEALVELGELSSLAPKLSPTGEHDFEHREPNVCVFYHRDRDEDYTINKFDSFKHYIEKGRVEEFNYIFKDSEWRTVKPNSKLLKKVKIRLTKLPA